MVTDYVVGRFINLKQINYEEDLFNDYNAGNDAGIKF
jgi:hypothetical protein